MTDRLSRRRDNSDDRQLFECDACGWQTIPPPHVRILFHPCRPKRRRRKLTIQELWTDYDRQKAEDLEAFKDRVFGDHEPRPSRKDPTRR